MLTDSARIWNVVYALEGAFIWNETPPGLEYWCDVCAVLIKLAKDVEAREEAVGGVREE